MSTTISEMALRHSHLQIIEELRWRVDAGDEQMIMRPHTCAVGLVMAVDVA
jgi:hypothetical protein